MTQPKMRMSILIPILYTLFLMLPIYWLVAMSFKTTGEILSGFSLFPQTWTFDNYRVIFTDPTWYWGYINSIIYVSLNTVISVTVALPAAYAFSRYSFLGDKHLFFWLLTNRMAPAAVFALPFFQLYSAVELFDTHLAVALAHCLFNIPLAVWILEGFMGGVPKELDETAAVDGYSFPRFFVTIFLPSIKAGVGVAAFFCFMFSWVELLLAKTLTAVAAKPIAATMTKTASSAGYELGLLAAAGRYASMSLTRPSRRVRRAPIRAKEASECCTSDSTARHAPPTIRSSCASWWQLGSSRLAACSSGAGNVCDSPAGCGSAANAVG